MTEHNLPQLPQLLQQAAWYLQPRAVWLSSSQVKLLRGGTFLFPAMIHQIEQANHEIWLATYLVHDDGAVATITEALVKAVKRGVQVYAVVDGFGSLQAVENVLSEWIKIGIRVTIYRPLHSWLSWLKPGHLRRLHMKLFVVDRVVGFVGGINLIDDYFDLRHGQSDQPRLDYAVEVAGPIVAPIEQTIRAMWTRAEIGRDWRDELAELVRGPGRLIRMRGLIRRLQLGNLPPVSSQPGTQATQAAVKTAFVVRDNLRQRRTIEHSYIEAITQAQKRIDLVSPYFYPGQAFRKALSKAAERGVEVRLLLQGKIDYRFAATAARVLYDELLSAGVRIWEYTPAFLHAKVALVDEDWATVGSSNIDPLSLLVNLEANLIIHDVAFAGAMAKELDEHFKISQEVKPYPKVANTLALRLRRSFIAWCAHFYLRLAGIGGRY